MTATSDSSSLHWEHCLESEGKVAHPSRSSGFTATASSYKKSQRFSGTRTRLAPAAWSGISCPCWHLIGAVGPASASEGASRIFLFNHCCNLQISKGELHHHKLVDRIIHYGKHKIRRNMHIISKMDDRKLIVLHLLSLFLRWGKHLHRQPYA